MSDLKRIALFTSGGDSPGMNACIRAIVRTASYHDLMITGILRGYEGMIDGDFIRMDASSVGNILHRGGTILKSARSERFRTVEGRKEAYEQLSAYDIDGVIAIGGNGTFTGAKVFSEEYGLPFIGVPGTIDNDLYGTDMTIGFDTALNTVVEAVDKIRDTADSHNRLFFIEVMGRDAGYIALHAGIGAGAGAILLPETETTIEGLTKMLRIGAKRKKLFNLIIVAEGNQNGGAIEVARKVNEQFDYYETKVTILGHIQRGGAPSCYDRVLASRLGAGAVTALLEGRRNMATGIQGGKVCYTPFEEAISRYKPLSQNLLNLAEVLSL